MPMSIKTSAETASADYSISRMLEQPGGFEKIALEKMPPFIRETRDYESFGRKVLLVHTVTGDELHKIDNEDYFYYPKDLNAHAAFYGQDMQVPRYQVEGDGVNVGIMNITSDDHTINLRRLMTQKFNYLERVRELAGQAVAKTEDRMVINLVETLLQGSGTATEPEHDGQVVTTTDTQLLKSHLVALKKTQSQNNLPVGCFVMNPSTLDDMLNWDHDSIDQLTQRELIETGVKYTIWGDVKLVTATIIPLTVVYSFSTPEYTGRMPILKDLSLRLTETSNKLEKGLFMFEFLGIYLANHKAVGKLIMNFTSGDKKIDIQTIDSALAHDGEKAKGYGALEG